MAVQPELTADFLSDLDVVCPKLDDVSLSMSFLSDLETAYAHAQTTSPQVPAVSVADLATLGEQLETWRRSQLRLVDEYKKKLPLDDPLHFKCCRTGNRMRKIGVAMLECTGSRAQGVDDCV